MSHRSRSVRLFRFSLRSLVLAVTIGAIASGWLARVNRKHQRIENQRLAIEWIEENGGTCTVLSDDLLVDVYFHDYGREFDDLTPLYDLPDLKYVHFSLNNDVDPAEMERLVRARPRLKVFHERKHGAE